MSAAPPSPLVISRRSQPSYVADVSLIQTATEGKPALPPGLASRGVTEAEFHSWLDHLLQSTERGNAFSACPLLGMCYWCCPFLCFQPCICMANPCSWYLTLRDKRAHDEGEEFVRVQAPEGLHFRWTMWQHAIWETTTLLEIRLDEVGIAPPLPEIIPPNLASIGATQQQWSRWRRLLVVERSTHCLSCCPPYLRLAYSFFPLGGLQPCLCILNPLTCVNAVRVGRARERCEVGINEDLEALNAHFRYRGGGRTCVFERGPRPPHLKKRQKKSGLAMVALVANGVGVNLPERMLQEAEQVEDRSQPMPVKV